MSATLGTLVAQMDIRNFSGEVAEIIKEELKNKISDGTIKNVPKDNLGPKLKKILHDTEAKNNFLSGYNHQFTATFSTEPLSAEITLKVNKEKLAPYVNDVFKKFGTSTGGVNVDQLLSPVMGSAISSFAEEAIKDSLKSKPEFEALVISGLSYLANQGVKVKEIGEKQISKEFQKIKNQLSKESQKIKNQLISGDFRDTLLNEVSKRANELLSKPANVVLSTEGNLKDQFTEGFENVCKQAKDAAASAFNELNTHTKSLTQNEIEVQKVINLFQDNIAKRVAHIKNLENDIRRFANSTNPDDLVKLGEKQIEHAKAVAANLFQTNIINSYIRDGIKFIGSIDSFAKTAENILKGDSVVKDIQAFGRNLVTLKTPTFSSVASTICFANDLTNKVEEVALVVDKLGLHGPAKTIGKFVGYAKVAIGIVGALLPPNPIGIIGAIGSLGGLFGGGGPTIEERMFQAMQDGFDQINDRLDNIQSSITNLQKMVQESYKDIMKSLKLISRQLEGIKEQLDLTDEMLYYLIYKEYNLIEPMLASKPNVRKMDLELYHLWYRTNKDSSDKVLSTLNTNLITRDNLSKFVQATFEEPGSGKEKKLIQQKEGEAYKKTLLLFKNFSFHTDLLITNLLLLPCQKNNSDTFWEGSQLSPSENYFDFDEWTAEYFNPALVAGLANNYCELQPFFIINDDNLGYQPVKTLDDLLSSANASSVKSKLNQSITRLNNSFEFISKGIVQQSILSGNIMIKKIVRVLYGNEVQNYHDTITAIDSNELLQKNLAVFLIHSSIKDMSTFFDRYSKLTNDPDKLTALDALLVWGEGRLSFGYDAGDTPSPLPCLHVLKKSPEGKTEIATKLTIPDINILQEQQMIYSDALYNLLAAKQKVMTSIIDIKFFQGLTNDDQASLYKEIFFLNDKL